MGSKNQFDKTPSLSMHDPNKRLNILTMKEIQALYGMPRFTPEERDAYFSLDPLEEGQRKSIRHTNAAIYFILQSGYFKAKKQFFVIDARAATDDIEYILKRFFPGDAETADRAISKPTRLIQQTQILQLYD